MLSVNLASSEISGKEVARINIPQNPHITILLRITTVLAWQSCYLQGFSSACQLRSCDSGQTRNYLERCELPQTVLIIPARISI